VLHRGHMCTASHRVLLLLAGRRDNMDWNRPAAVFSISHASSRGQHTRLVRPGASGRWRGG
jgi:hypothetical protein